MRRYVLWRLAQAVGVLWAAYTLTFLLLDLLPGDPVAAMAGAGLNATQVTPERLAELRTEYGFDRPFLVRYATSLGDALRGDLGNSVATGRPVAGTLAEALPQTLQLAAVALPLAVLAGGGLAMAATATRRRWLRQLLLSVPSVGISLPSFWVGLMLVQLFSFRLHLFPAFGNDGAAGLALPAVTLAMPAAVLVAQVLAKSLADTLGEPYIQTARAKGAGRVRVHVHHALRNASLPALTVVGMLAGQLTANAVVVENVFSRNGLGRITTDAVTVQDIPVVQGVVVFGALVFVLVNLLVDLAYPLLDHRIVTAGRRSPA
ncbi:ABC transporter permease [Streptomyces sp. NBC_00015]|uniref:ABC transporter permease n=1 Tax=unclassified Streptomyces TaxID=2593676 RepID=UPI00224CBE1D|nr:ABC transporter permease [Streptomyces sp. NBC_00103]MCX5372718.1 ABC transporter permease [Streptomyces sp. NBC_00103]